MKKHFKTVTQQEDCPCGQRYLVLGDKHFSLNVRRETRETCSFGAVNLLVAKFIKNDCKDWLKDIEESFRGHRCGKGESCYSWAARCIKEGK